MGQDSSAIGPINTTFKTFWRACASLYALHFRFPVLIALLEAHVSRLTHFLTVRRNTLWDLCLAARMNAQPQLAQKKRVGLIRFVDSFAADSPSPLHSGRRKFQAFARTTDAHAISVVACLPESNVSAPLAKDAFHASCSSPSDSSSRSRSHITPIMCESLNLL